MRRNRPTDSFVGSGRFEAVTKAACFGTVWSVARKAGVCRAEVLEEADAGWADASLQQSEL